jgi:putative acetyltransferase
MDDPEAFWKKRLGILRGEIQNKETFVYDEDNILKGFLTVEGNHILELFVDKPYQHKGIGSALLEKGLIITDLSKPVYVNVYMLNHIATKFYIKSDFVITHIYVEDKTGFAKFIMQFRR